MEHETEPARPDSMRRVASVTGFSLLPLWIHSGLFFLLGLLIWTPLIGDQDENFLELAGLFAMWGAIYSGFGLAVGAMFSAASASKSRVGSVFLFALVVLCWITTIAISAILFFLAAVDCFFWCE